MRIILYSLVSLLLMVNFCFAGEKEELIDQKAYLERKIQSTLDEFKGIQIGYEQRIRDYQNDLQAVTKKLQEMEKAGKAKNETHRD